jgi:hypothetical protein
MEMVNPVMVMIPQELLNATRQMLGTVDIKAAQWQVMAQIFDCLKPVPKETIEEYLKELGKAEKKAGKTEKVDGSSKITPIKVASSGEDEESSDE